MDALRRTVAALGRGGVAALLLSPLLAGAIVLALSGSILAAKYGSSARLDTYPVIGTHASYEVASSISDFGTTYMTAAGVAGEASGQEPADAAPFLTATRSADSALAQIAFQAPTREGAEQGLRAAARTALTAVAQSNLTRAQMAEDGATRELTDAMNSMDDPIPSALPQKAVRASREQRVTSAGNALDEARTARATAKVALERVPSLVSQTPVDVQQVSTTSDAARLALAAAATAFLLAAAVVVFLRRRQIFAHAAPLPADRTGASTAHDRV